MIGLIILGAVGILAGTYMLSDSETALGAVLSVLTILAGAVFFVIGLLMLGPEEPAPVEYPASEYTLELKVTEYQGQKDTTYVLIPKETIK